MKLLLVSPLAYKASPEIKYGGIERLVYQYSSELVKNHSVTVIGLEDSIYPEGVKLLPVPFIEPLQNEVKAYQAYSYLFKGFDVIHDFSMLHIVGRLTKLPALSIFWHAPSLAKYAKANYNIIALSDWAKWEFQRIYRQESIYKQSIVLDLDVYKPKLHRGDRFLTLGIMNHDKGNLDAIKYCKKFGIKLDVVGGRGSPTESPLTEYEKQIQSECDGDKIRFLGEVDEEQKIRLLQTAKALLYFPHIPEVTSHKSMEAIACGCPVIAPNVGALPEVIEHGKTGYIFDDVSSILNYINNLSKIDENYCHQSAQQWSIQKVVSDYTPLYERVLKGEYW